VNVAVAGGAEEGVRVGEGDDFGARIGVGVLVGGAKLVAGTGEGVIVRVGEGGIEVGVLVGGAKLVADTGVKGSASFRFLPELSHSNTRPDASKLTRL